MHLECRCAAHFQDHDLSLEDAHGESCNEELIRTCQAGQQAAASRQNAVSHPEMVFIGGRQRWDHCQVA